MPNETQEACDAFQSYTYFFHPHPWICSHIKTQRLPNLLNLATTTHDTTIIIFVSVPMCIHDITVNLNMYNMCCLFVLLICRHALVKSCFKKNLFEKVYHMENIIDVLFEI